MWNRTTIERCLLRALGTHPLADPIPFDAVYSEHGPHIYRFCLSQVRDVHTAEDVTADVFVSALRAYERTRPDPDGVRIWLFSIARHAIIDRHRRSTRWLATLGALTRTGAGSEEVERLAGLRQELRDVIEAMDRLPPRDRMLVGLRHVAELPYADIGQLLGMTEQAASTATYRALDQLRRELGPRHGD